MLWDKYPQFYNKHNTVMFDDLRRNYVMNRQNGLVIRPFRKARFRQQLRIPTVAGVQVPLLRSSSPHMHVLLCRRDF